MKNFKAELENLLSSPITVLTSNKEEYQELEEICERIVNTNESLDDTFKTIKSTEGDLSFAEYALKKDENLSKVLSIAYLEKYLKFLLNKLQDKMEKIDSKWEKEDIDLGKAQLLSEVLCKLLVKDDDKTLIKLDFYSFEKISISAKPYYVICHENTNDQIYIKLEEFDNKLGAFKYCLVNGISKDYIVGRYLN